MQLAFPFAFDHRGRTAESGADAHLREMIEMLLFTAPGERVNRPDFGCGLAQLVFAPNNPEVAAALQFTVQASLDRWLGDVVEVQDLAVTSEDARLTVDLTYRARRTGVVTRETFERDVG